MNAGEKWWRSECTAEQEGKLDSAEHREKAFLIWLQYYVACDQFDISLAGHWYTPYAFIPYDRRASFAHARDAEEDALRAIREENICDEVSDAMRKIAQGMSPEKQRDLLRYLKER